MPGDRLPGSMCLQMAHTGISEERDLRRTIAENEAAIARIYEQIHILEDRLVEIQTRHSEAVQFPQQSVHGRHHRPPSLG